MKKQIGKNLMQKWKNKIRVRLSALDKKETGFYKYSLCSGCFLCRTGHFFFNRNSPGEDMGNKLLYAMEHADRNFLLVLC